MITSMVMIDEAIDDDSSASANTAIERLSDGIAMAQGENVRVLRDDYEPTLISQRYGGPAIQRWHSDESVRVLRGVASR